MAKTHLLQKSLFPNKIGHDGLLDASRFIDILESVDFLNPIMCHYTHLQDIIRPDGNKKKKTNLSESTFSYGVAQLEVI